MGETMDLPSFHIVWRGDKYSLRRGRRRELKHGRRGFDVDVTRGRVSQPSMAVASARALSPETGGVNRPRIWINIIVYRR